MSLVIRLKLSGNGRTKRILEICLFVSLLQAIGWQSLPTSQIKKKEEEVGFLAMHCYVFNTTAHCEIKYSFDRNKTLLQDIFSASSSIHDIIYRQPIKQTNGTYLVELPNQSNPSKSILGNFLTFMKIPPLLTVNVFI